MHPELFEQQALPLFDQLYNFAHWLTGDRADAEDLVQETYAKALKGFKSFEQGTNLRAWMFRILRNTFLTSRTGLAARGRSLAGVGPRLRPTRAGIVLSADREGLGRRQDLAQQHDRLGARQLGQRSHLGQC